MAEQIKFTNEELESINKLRQDVANVFTRLGQLTLEKKRRISEVEQAENELTVKHSNLVSEEQELFKSLNEKYGDTLEQLSYTYIRVYYTKNITRSK